MAADTILRPLAAPGPSQRLVGHGRGNRTRILLDLNDALEPCVEGIAFGQEVDAIANRIALAAAAGSRMAVVNEAGKLSHRAARVIAEMRRLAADIEGPDAA